jgi:hypothetical protein
MSDDFEPEAGLLREALRQDAEAQGFRPLNAAELLGGRAEATLRQAQDVTLRQAQGSSGAQGSDGGGAEVHDLTLRQAQGSSGSRRRVTAAGWGRGMVAAAAAVALIALGVTVLPRLVGASTAGSAAVPEPPRAGASAQADGEVTEAAAGPLGGAGPAGENGWRWESYRDVMVQVPADWRYDTALTSAWCAAGADGSDTPPPAAGPFVDLRRGDEPIPAIGCQGQPPSSSQAMHLSFRPAGTSYGETLGEGDWEQYVRELGAARVVVVAEPADADLARQILDSAMQVDTDSNSCPAVEPATEVVDIAGLAPETISVCAYDNLQWPDAGETPRATSGEPNLRASARLEGEAAASALAAILAAPGGGGPDGDPAECGTLPAAYRAVLLLDGTAVRFDFSGCRGNGLADSGAKAGLRRVTGDMCLALFVDPIRFWTASGPVGQVCLGPLWEP